MWSIFIIVTVLVVFFLVIQRYVIGRNARQEYDYQKKNTVLNANEVAFYNALKAAVAEQGVILPKVSMAQVVSPKKQTNKKDWFIANNRIARSYFDFVICDPRNLAPRVAIELNDGKALNKKKVEREKQLIQVCKTANLPLIGTNVRHSYQVSRLRRLLAAHIDLIEPDKEVRFCKRCGSPMLVRVASQGEFKGHRFYTCSRLPHCTYTENYNTSLMQEEGTFTEQIED